VLAFRKPHEPALQPLRTFRDHMAR
jgi:hypothetical protein